MAKSRSRKKSSARNKPGAGNMRSTGMGGTTGTVGNANGVGSESSVDNENSVDSVTPMGDSDTLGQGDVVASIGDVPSGVDAPTVEGDSLGKSSSLGASLSPDDVARLDAFGSDEPSSLAFGAGGSGKTVTRAGEGGATNAHIDEPLVLNVGHFSGRKTVVREDGQELREHTGDEILADLEPLIAELLEPLAMENDVAGEGVASKGKSRSHSAEAKGVDSSGVDPSVDDMPRGGSGHNGSMDVGDDSLGEVDPDELVPWDITFDDGPVLVVHSILDDGSVVRSVVELDEDEMKRLVPLTARVERYYNGERKFFRRIVDWSFLHPGKAIPVGILLVAMVGLLLAGL